MTNQPIQLDNYVTCLIREHTQRVGISLADPQNPTNQERLELALKLDEVDPWEAMEVAVGRRIGSNLQDKNYTLLLGAYVQDKETARKVGLGDLFRKTHYQNLIDERMLLTD